MAIRLIASDVDGTILPRGGVISERTIRAVRACEAAGVRFVIASGRWYVSAKVIADALLQTQGHMIIANGGAVVRLNGEIEREWTLPRADAEHIYRAAKGENLMINAFVRDAVYRVNTRAMRTPPKGVGDYFGGSYHMHNDDVPLFERYGLQNPYKVELYGEDPAVLERFRAQFVSEGYSVSSAFSTNIEVMAPGCGKGAALKWLLSALHLDRAQSVAFGDNTNDLSLLAAAGCGVAVADAADALRRAADRVCGPCAADGVAGAIEEILAGEAGSGV